MQMKKASSVSLTRSNKLMARSLLSAKIKEFLETFEGEKDVTRGIEEMDLADEGDDVDRRKKYKRQLVRPALILFFSPAGLDSVIA